MSFLKNISGSTLTDAELVQAFKQTADLSVLALLYERYMDLVYGVCLKYLKDAERAKDSVLSIFEVLVDKVQKHAVEHFRGWLYQLTRNYCLMQLRKDKTFKKAVAKSLFMQIAEPVHLNGEWQREDKLEVLQYCLAQLGQEQRQAVELFYLQGKSYKEMAPLMGLDVNTIRSYLQNGRRNLKICMDKKITVT